MKKKIFIFSLFCILSISGCTVISFYPLYTEDVLILDKRIEGKWESIPDKKETAIQKDILIWEIAKQKENQFYNKLAVTYSYKLRIYSKDSPDNTAEFTLFLVKLGNNIFLDFFPEDIDCQNEWMSIHVVPVHTFAKINFTNGRLSVAWFNSEWLQKLFDQNKIRMNHERNDSHILLTAKPEELQKFVLKYADDAKAFEDGMRMDMKKAL